MAVRGKKYVGSEMAKDSFSCCIEDCEKPEVHFHMVRYTFALPESIGVEDGYNTQHRYESPQGLGIDMFVEVTIRQVQVDSTDPNLLLTSALMEVAGAEIVKDSPPESTVGSPLKPRDLSIVQAATLASSPDEPPEDWDSRMSHLGPREDSFMRALDAAQSVVRGARLACEKNFCLLPTYERISPVVVVNEALMEHQLPLTELYSIKWGEPSLMLLEQLNLADIPPEPVGSDLVGQWIIEVGMKNPALRVKERFLEAERLMSVEGEYGDAVIAAATSVEILCSTICSALFFEDFLKKNPIRDIESEVLKVASIFTKIGSPLKLATKHISPKLKGNWTSPASPWELYRCEAASLRNRIVHAGYQPQRKEAEATLQCVLAAQSFIFDQLATQRVKYPRTSLLFLGRPGLERRGLYNGQIKQLIEQDFFSDREFSEKFSRWHRAVIESSQV